MKQRAVLITGCSSGIGYCAAKQLRGRGYRVFATARRSEDAAHLADQGFEALRLDLDDSDSIGGAVDQVLSLTGDQLYGLFNNGAYGQPGAVEDLRREVVRAQFETNLFGTLELTNRIIPVMRRQGHGRIIFNSSVLGLVAMPYRGAYNASKFALEGLADTLRLELHGSGIHVSLIEPGPIQSQFRANALAKYRENIDAASSVHRATYEAMERRLHKPGPSNRFTLEPEAVIDKLVHALESPRPKIRYYVTTPTYLFSGLKRIIGHRLLDRVMRKVSEGENQ